MATERDPWNIRSSDFNRGGLNALRTRAYWLFFQFLRTSPTYALAHIEATKGLSEAQQAQLPPDFHEVRATYALLGDVWHCLYRQWWLTRGLPAFGQVGNRPKVRTVQLLPAGGHPSLEVALRDYQASREDEGLVPALLLSLPLTLKRSEVLAEVKKLLEQHGTQEAPIEPKLKLMGQRQRSQALFKGLQLLWTRASMPKDPLWKVGAVREINPNVSKFLDWRQKEREAKDKEVDRRKVVTSGTWRDLMKYQTIAENAARGRFPCQDDVTKVEFDYPLLRRRIKAWNAWEEKERARLLAVRPKQRGVVSNETASQDSSK